MGSERKDAATKNVLFINKIQGDGLGDLGHLIDIVHSVQFDALFPQQDSLGNGLKYQPLYYIILSKATPSRLRFVLQSLIDNKIIDNTGNPYDINNDKSLLAFLQFIHKKNPHFVLNLSSMRLNEYIDPTSLDIETTPFNKTIKLAASFVISYTDEEVSAFSQEITAINPCSCTQILEHGRNTRIHRSLPLSHFDHMYGMGLAPREYGILLSPQQTLGSAEKALLVSQMHNQNFVTDLLGQKTASNKTIEDYLTHTLFIPCYWQKRNNTWRASIIEALATSPEGKNYKDIVFYLSKPSHLSSDLDLDLDLDLDSLRINGFNKIVVNNQESSIPDATSNRCLRILNASHYNLDNHDYENLSKLATRFGGCSGDKTLERTLSHHLIPLYDAPRPEKVILDSLIELAKQHLLAPENIVAYLESLQSFGQPTSDLATTIDENFIAQWDLLINKIYENHNFYDQLPKIIQKSITVNDFFCNHFEDFKNHIHLEQYVDAIEQIHHAHLDFFDLMTIVRHQLSADEQSAAFIYQYIISTELLEKNAGLGRTQEEIQMDNQLLTATNKLFRDHIDTLNTLSHKFGYDRIDFLGIEKNRTAHQCASGEETALSDPRTDFLKRKEQLKEMKQHDTSQDQDTPHP